MEVNVYMQRHLGIPQYTVAFGEESVTLPLGVWDYPSIVSAVVRAHYSEDAVEAILNNYLAEPSEEHKADFDALQQWRAEAKQIAKEALEKGGTE